MEDLRPLRVVHFDPRSPHYKCCCDCIHATAGAVIVGIVELLFVLINISRDALNYAGLQDQSLYTTSFVVTILLNVLVITTIVSMFYGIHKGLSLLVLPQIIIQILGVIGSCMECLFCLLALGGNEHVARYLLGDAYYDTNADNGGNFRTLAFWAAVYLILTFVQLWFTVITLRCYRFLRDRKAYDSYHVRYMPHLDLPAHDGPVFAPPPYELNASELTAKSEIICVA